MNQYDHLRPNDHWSLIGSGKVVLSMKLGDFVDWKLFLRSPSRKKDVFLDETLFSRSVSKKMGIFLDGKVADKKETPSKGCLRKVLRCTRLLIQRSSNVNSACNCTTYHWVVTDAEGHFCELCVRVHTAHSVGHISNGYRPYAACPYVSHWTSTPYEVMLCRNPGRNSPKSVTRSYWESCRSSFLRPSSRVGYG